MASSTKMSGNIAKSDSPSPTHQRQIIARLEEEEEESVHVYCVAKKWHDTWRKYVGIVGETDSSSTHVSRDRDGHKPSCMFNAESHEFIHVPDAKGKKETKKQSPGPLTMDNEVMDENMFVDEKIWCQWVEWYGVSPEHELDRRNWTSEESQYEICMLTPYSGIIVNPVKTFDVSEETGYIEMQLRRIFKVAKHRKSRLWMCERSRNSRFHPLLDRDQAGAFEKGIETERDYILALEIGNHDNSWPTSYPGEPKGSLEKYLCFTDGGVGKDFWEAELAATVDSVFTGITTELKETVGGLVQTTKCITALKEKELTKAKSSLDQQLHAVTQVQRTFEDKVKDIIKQEEVMKCEAKRMRKDREHLDQEKNRLAKEMLQMEELNRISESRVRLDVGGHIFTTSLLTLTKDPTSMLAAMFSGRHSISREADGTFFIDRDGTYFRYILNYLRDGGFRAGTLPTDPTVKSELLTEAEYYQIPSLVKLLTQHGGGGATAESHDQDESEAGADHMTPERLISPKKMLRKIVKK